MISIWHFDVVLPYFANSTVVEEMSERYLLHLALLTYLDNAAFQALPAAAYASLGTAATVYALPFADEEQLARWQAYLLQQMAPAGRSETIAIFAARLRMTPEEFAAKLHDPDWMDRELFARIPVSKIQKQLDAAVSRSLDLVSAYWNGRPRKEMV